MHKQSPALIPSALLVLSLLLPQSVPAAVPSSDAVKAAIVKSKLLDPGIELVMAADPTHPDRILVSTFLHGSATDRDCKFDAFLIGKAVMESAPDIHLVTVSFVSTADLSTYKQVSVKSTDVQVFENGQVNKESLLKSLEVQVGQTADSPSNLTALLRQTSLVKGLQVAVAGKLVELSVQVDLSRSQLDTKLEALQLAQNALAAAPEGMTSVKVSLQDAYEPGKIKQISFDKLQLQSMAHELQSALAKVAIEVGAPSAGTTTVCEGEYKQQRQKLLASIKDLEKKGVGVQAFMGFFKSIEMIVGNDKLNRLESKIKSLQTAVDEQEKTIAAVKNRQSQLKNAPEKVAAPVTAAPAVARNGTTMVGDLEFDFNRAGSEPDRYAQELEQHFMSQKPITSQHATFFAIGLMRISQTLTQNGKTADAERFRKRAVEVSALVRNMN